MMMMMMINLALSIRSLMFFNNFALISWFWRSWHDAGTYDAENKTGGANGSIRNEEEYSHGANNGLKKAIDFCGICLFLISLSYFYFLFFAKITIRSTIDLIEFRLVALPELSYLFFMWFVSLHACLRVRTVCYSSIKLTITRHIGLIYVYSYFQFFASFLLGWK